jgi:hypothetical protein
VDHHFASTGSGVDPFHRVHPWLWSTSRGSASCGSGHLAHDHDDFGCCCCLKRQRTQIPVHALSLGQKLTSKTRVLKLDERGAVSAEFAVALPAVLAVVAVLLAGFKIANAGAGDIRALSDYVVAASRGENQALLDEWAKKQLSGYRVTTYIEDSSLCAEAVANAGVARVLKRCVWVGDY